MGGIEYKKGGIIIMIFKKKFVLIVTLILMVSLTFSACDFLQDDVKPEEEPEDNVEEEPEEEPEVVAIDGMFYHYDDTHTITLDVENRGGDGEITIELKTSPTGAAIIRETYKVASNETYEYRWEYTDSSRENSFHVYIYIWDGKEYVKTDYLTLFRDRIVRP